MSVFESEFTVGDQAYIFTDVGTCVLTTLTQIKFTPGAVQNPFDPEVGFTYVTNTENEEAGFIERIQALCFVDKAAAIAYIDSIGM